MTQSKETFLVLSSALLIYLGTCGVLDNTVGEDDIIASEGPSVHVCNVAEEIKKEVLKYGPVANKIMKTAVEGKFKGKTWSSLAEFVDTFGSRIAGSKNLENAIDYMLKKLQDEGLENVHGEVAKVPHWVRGKESAKLLLPRKYNLRMLGLGGSVGTPPEGITAEVIVVATFDELHNKSADQVKGKIVVFNEKYISYGETVEYRDYAAEESAKLGAVAALVRSVTPFSIGSPHTGWQDYSSNITQIPVACITVEDAEMLHRMYQRGQHLMINLKMEAKNLPMADSRNTIGELKGREREKDVVVVSGHLDSWDVGQGAMDDAGGAFISWNSVVLLKKLGLRPRRTIRAILWTAEEEGLWGSQSYYNAHKNETDQFKYMMESDEGTFTPHGISFSGKQEAGCILKEVLKLLKPLNATDYTTPEDGGPDIRWWTNVGVPGSSLINDNEKYFWFHHSDGDMMTVEDPHALDLCTAIWAVVSYVIADISVDLPR